MKSVAVIIVSNKNLLSKHSVNISKKNTDTTPAVNTDFKQCRLCLSVLKMRLDSSIFPLVLYVFYYRLSFHSVVKFRFYIIIG